MESEDWVSAVKAQLAQDKVDIENLEVALASARKIGTAMGILMCSHKIAEGEAFELLRLASQRSHIKVRDIADHVVLTGALEPPN